ncbi:MAG: hypothetical protein QM697_03330 [Lachnospiraceae bacterium]
MKKKTKWIAVLLCLGVFATMALGSGSSDSSETKDIVTTEANEASGTEVDSGIIEEADVSSADVTIQEQVLVDQDGIVITATEYTTDSIWGDGIELLVENNSGQDVTVGCTALIVNDYMITDLFVSDVAAGKKSNETMYLSSSELKAAGIDSVGQIEVYFHIYDSASYENIFNTDAVTIQTSEYANMDTTPNDSGKELYNEGGIRIVGKTVDENSFWGTAILLYVENTSGSNIGVQCDNMSINGFMMTPYFSCNVYDGKKAINDVTIMSSELEANGIESIDEIELQFHIYNVDTYDTIADSDPITFSAQ